MLLAMVSVSSLLGCPAEEAPDDSVPSALDDEAFRFCHVPGANAEEARDWCSMLDGEADDRCPGLRATCEDGAVATDPVYSRGCDEGTTGPADRLAADPETPPPEPKGCDELEAFDEAGLQALMRWVAAIFVGVMLLVLLRMLWGTLGWNRTRPADLPPVSQEEDEDELLPDVPNLPSTDLLGAAREALRQGDLGQAVLLARGAALKHLGESGRLRLHRSRTDREYVRNVRGPREVEDDLKEVVVAVEIHRWGGAPLGLPRAERAVAAAERLLALAGALLLALWLGLSPSSAHAQTPERFAPSGDAALVKVLELHGYDAGWRLRNLADLDENTDVVILDLSAVGPTEEQQEHLRTWVDAGGVLMVGGDATDMFPELGEHLTLPPDTGARLGILLEGSDIAIPRWPNGVLYAYDAGEAWVVATGRSGDSLGAAVAVLYVGAGVVVGIADPRLIWNGAFVSGDNESFVGDLLYLGQGFAGWPLPTPARVQLATTAATSGSGGGAGAQSNNPCESMSNAKLLPFVLQLLITWLLLGLWRGWPFAPLRDPPSEGRLVFAEHVQALGTRWYRLKASRHALGRMAAFWLSRLGHGGLRLAAERAGKTPAQARAWVDGLQQLADADEQDVPGSAEDLDRMEELWKVTNRSG